MPEYYDYNGARVYADSYGGGIFTGNLWYPFRFFITGEIDILTDDGLVTAELAYDRYREIYT